MLFSHAAAQRLCRGLSRECLCRVATSKTGKTGRAARLLRDEPRAPLSLAARSGSRRSSSSSSSAQLTKEPLKQWTLVVNPFGSVRVHLRCSISVSPLDPHSFPEANRAFITVRGTRADQGLRLDNVRVRYDERDKELLIVSENVNSSVSVDLSAPIKSDLHITTSGDGNVSIRNMECDTCQVVTENGNCVLHSIKAVDIKKVQGTRMNVSTEHGSLNVKAIYAESTCVSSSSGNVKLGSVHGDSTVQSEKGNVVIDGSDGYVRVSSREGDIDAYVGQRGSAELRAQHGSVSVRVPASLSAAVLLHGVSVDISPEVDLQEVKCRSTDTHTTITAHLNGKADGGRRIEAWAEKGVVRLKTQSWFESLKIESYDNTGQQMG
uniref:Family with sequence similarity 185 member A n=1 Tax=Scleropages formosus TaxID=113540 RepID=A0A8C9WS77_SCLFO